MHWKSNRYRKCSSVSSSGPRTRSPFISCKIHIYLRKPFAFPKLLFPGGIGHMATSQLSFQKTNWRHQHSHGGSLRQKRAGRGARPLSTKQSIHLVFKANKDVIRGGFRLHRRFALIHHLLQRYRMKFWIRIEQVSIQGDHIHLLIRTTRRSQYLYFFRVLAGQIAQKFEKEGLLTVPSSRTAVTSSNAAVTSSNAAVSANAKALASSSQHPNKGVTDTPKWKVSVEAGSFGASKVSVKARAVTDTPGRQVSVEGTSLRSGLEMSSRSIQNQSFARLKRLWKQRPFTRVVKGWRAYKTVRDYIQLNEKEALAHIPYRSERLRGLSSSDWEILWR